MILKKLLSGMVASLAIAVGSLWAVEVPPGAVELEGVAVHPTRLLAKAKSGTPAIEALSSVVVLDETLPAALTLPDGKPAPASRDAIARRLGMRLETFRSSGRYEWVEPDYVVRKASLPTDAYLVNGMLWGLRMSSGVDLDADDAWEVTLGAPSVVVGILDSGIQRSHPEFAGALWINPGESGGGKETNGRDDDRDGYIDNVYGANVIGKNGSIGDSDGHGTAIASIIGARANDGAPLVGMAPGVTLMPIRVLDSYGFGFTSDLLDGIRFAIRKGVRILNVSLGGTQNSSALQSAISDADNAGMLVIAAAGNESKNNDTTPHYPASFPLANVLSVTGVDFNGRLPGWANWGLTSVDIAAPGADIRMASIEEFSPYQVGFGTSAAAAYTSGIAALLLSAEPSLSVSEVRARLLQSVVPLDDLEGKIVTGGMVNASYTLRPSRMPWFLSIRSSAVEPYPGSEVLLHVHLFRGTRITGSTVQVQFPDGRIIQGRDDGLGGDTVAGDSVHAVRVPLPEGTTQITFDVVGFQGGVERVRRTLMPRIELRPISGNDAFASALELDLARTLTSTLAGTTVEPGEPVYGSGGYAASGWWKWTAPSSGTLSVQVNSSSSPNDAMVLYSGTRLSDLNEVARAYAAAFQYNRYLSVRVTAGTAYRLAYASPEPVGTYSISARFESGPAPMNDALNAAFQVPQPLPAVMVGDNRTATIEPFEQSALPGAALHASVWWKFTPARRGLLRVSSTGEKFQSRMVVFRGTPGVRLEPASIISVSRLNVEVQSLETHYIGILGVPWQSGEFRVEVDFTGPLGRPSNDHFDAAPHYPPEAEGVAGTTTDALLEPGEPSPFSEPQSGSVWWKWTAPRSATVGVGSRQHSGFNESRIAVFTGSSLSSLVLVSGVPSAASPPSYATFSAQAGVTYHIRVTTVGSGLEENSFRLNLVQSPAGGRPANDAFAAAEVRTLSDYYTSIVGSTVGATRESGEPDHGAPSITSTVWYRITAPNEMIMRIGMQSELMHRVALYRGNSLSQLQFLDEHRRGASDAFTRVMAGESIWIMVGAEDAAEGPFTLKVWNDNSLELWQNSQAADRFSTAPLLVRYAYPHLGSATLEAGEPSHAGATPRVSHWWRLQGLGLLEELMLEDHEDSAIEMTLYAGTALGALTQIATTVGTTSQRLNVHLVEGGIYHLAVHSSNKSPGGYQLARYKDAGVRVNGRTGAVFPGSALSIWDLSWGSNSRWMLRLPGGSWTEIVDDTVWSGVASHSLMLGSFHQSMNGVQIGMGRRAYLDEWWEPNVQETVRLVLVPTSPTGAFSVHPQSAGFAPGAEVVLSAAASGYEITGLSWQRRDAGSSAWTEVVGAEGLNGSGELRIGEAGASENGAQFRAVANRLGGGPIFSNAATLTLNGVLPTDRFLGQPQDVSIAAWDNAVFSVPYERAPGTRLVWQHQDLLTRSWSSLPAPGIEGAGEPDGTLVLRNVSIVHRGLKVRAVLVRKSAPPIISQSASLSVSVRPTRLQWVDMPVEYGLDLPGLMFFSNLSFDSVPRRIAGVTLTPSFTGLLPVGVHTFHLTYDDRENGYQPASLTFSVRVIPRTLHIRPVSVMRRVGWPLQLTEYQVRGWPGGLHQLAFDDPLALSTPATSSSPPGEYPIQVTGGRSPNFNIQRYEGTLTLLPSESQQLAFQLNGQSEIANGLIANRSGLGSDSVEYLPTAGTSGFRYDGSTSTLTLSSSMTNALRSLSVSAWIRPDGSGTADSFGRTPILWKGAANPFALSWIPSTRRLRFEITSASGAQIMETPASLPNGLWTHVAATYSETSGKAELHVNGERMATVSGWLVPLGSTEPISVGGHAGTGAYFRGSIVTPRINGRVLESIEIRQLAQAGAQSFHLADFADLKHLSGHWKSLPWFGKVYAGAEFPWVYHETHGWIYLSLPTMSGPAVGRNALHFYDPKAVEKGWFGWAFASAEYYPWLWVRESGGISRWWYFDRTSSPGERSFRKPSGEWVKEGPGS